MRLCGKVAIITGAGSGSGQAGAVVFAREGAKVIVADIDVRGGEKSVELVRQSGGEADFVQVDCGKVEDMERLIKAAVNRHGKLDILWNHAGIPGPGKLEDTDEAGYDRVMNVNMKGGFFATKFAVPHMKEAGGGSIIFTASVSALRASPWSPSYSLSKGGILPLVMSLAVYLGPFNIRANCICPAGIDTPMLRVFTDRESHLSEQNRETAVKSLGEKCPLGRLATAEDVAHVALFLASDEASYLNGVAIPVDGGKIGRY